MLWEHDGDMHHAFLDDDDLTAEGAADAKRAEPGDQTMVNMLNNVLASCAAIVVTRPLGPSMSTRRFKNE